MKRAASFVLLVVGLLPLSARAQAEVEPSTERAEAAPTETVPAEAPADERAPTESAPNGLEPAESAPLEDEPTPAGDDEPPTSADSADLDALLRETVVGTASRIAERPTEVPSTVTTFTGEELLATGMRDVTDALSFLGVGIVSTRTRGHYYGQDEIGARGVVLRDLGRHVLFLLDGHVMNVQSAGGLGPQWLGIPLERIDHVEVALGPGSVLYGSSAMIAVVHIVTRSPDRQPRAQGIGELVTTMPSERDHGVALPGGASRMGFAYRVGASFAVPIRIRSQRGWLDAHVEWQQGLGETFELAPRNDINVSRRLDGSPWGGTAHIESRAVRAHMSARLGQFTLRAIASTDQATDPTTGIFNSPDSTWRYRVGRVDLQHRALPTARAEIQSRLFLDVHDIARDAAANSPVFCPPFSASMLVPCSFRTRQHVIGVGLEEVATVDWNLDGKMLTMAGAIGTIRALELDYGRLYDYATGVPAAIPTAPTLNHTTFVGAIFAEQIVRPVSWYRFNIGGRIDADDQFGFHFSPRAAMIFRPTSHATLRISYSEAFRAPSYQELHERHFNVQIPSGSLSPETVRDAEIEWTGTYSHVEVATNAFATFYRDLIASRGATMSELDDAVAAGFITASTINVRMLDNISSIASFGGIGRMRVDIGRGVSFSASGTYAHSRTHVDGGPKTPLSLTPTFTGNARISYQFGREGTTLALATTYVTRRHAWVPVGTSSQSVPFAVDTRITASGRLGRDTGLHYRASVGYAYPYVTPIGLGDGPTATSPSDTAQQLPLPGLHLLVGLRYELDR